MEFSLGDLNKEEDQAFRKIKLRIEDVKVRSALLQHDFALWLVGMSSNVKPALVLPIANRTRTV